MKFTEIRNCGETFSGKRDGSDFIASYDLFLIGQARNRGCDFEDLADGFGKGLGTHGDWSGIRDSTPESVNEMLGRALNYLFN